METIKVILPASSIPEGSDVTKIGGSKKYTLTSIINYYGDQAPPDVIADDNCKFLCGIGSITAISADKELVWHTTLERLNEYTNNLYEECYG